MANFLDTAFRAGVLFAYLALMAETNPEWMLGYEPLSTGAFVALCCGISGPLFRPVRS